MNELPLAEVLPPLGSSICDSSSETVGRLTGVLAERAWRGRVVCGGDDVMGEDEPEVGGLADTCNGCFVDHL